MNPSQTSIYDDSENSEDEASYTASSNLPAPTLILRSQPGPDYPSEPSSSQPARSDPDHPSIAASMSQYSSSSADDSVYSMPGPQQYQLVTPYDERSMSQVSPGFIYDNKDQLIAALRANRYNTITDLRRVERIFAYLDEEEVTEPMTRAWRHYVDSHNFLSELRTLTRNYPFSSECLDEAKILVQQDPESIRSWNYCWLILVKIQNE
ncbi:MAG: hypothetical protein Q9160_000431 [Pyrenula sp. 1 TL-2023]